jgi:acyl-coenzyme A synthetase/AMP-(fatty) acid ligase
VPTPTADMMIAHARARLATYKAPRRVIFIDDLPRTPTGKIKRRDLPRIAESAR